MKGDDNVGSDDDSVGSDEAVGPFQYGLNTPPKLDSEDGNPTNPKSFWSMEDHREPKVHYQSDSSSQSDETEDDLESYTAEPVSSPDEADAAYAAGLIHGDDKSVSLSPHVKEVIKQVAADDADSDEDSDDEDSEDVDTSFNQVTSPSSLVNKFSPTILTRLSEEDEGPATDDDKENRSDDTKEEPNEQSYTPLSISNEEQSYAPLSIPNKSVADFFDKNPSNQPDTTEVQEQVRKQYVEVLEELKQRGDGAICMAKDKATELTDKLLGTHNDGEQMSSKAIVVKTPFLQPRLSQGNDNFSQELEAGTQRGAATVETPLEIFHLFETPSDPDKKGSGGGRAKYREDTPFNSKAVTFADNKLGRWTSPNDEESSVDEEVIKNKVSSYTPVPYNSKTGTFSAPTLDDEEESDDTEGEKEASEKNLSPSPNTKPGVFTAPIDESSPLSGYELVESPEEGKATNTSVIWPTDERRTTTNKSPTETINYTNQFDTEPAAYVLQDLLDMSYVASTPDASSCNVHHKRRVMFIIHHKKVAEDIVAMIIRNDGHDIELMDLAEKFDRFL